MDGRPERRARGRGPERAHFLLEQLPGARPPEQHRHAVLGQHWLREHDRGQPGRALPGNIEIEERLRAYMRWNAMAMVVRRTATTRRRGDLGGHIGSFASLAHLFGAGFNHFWHAESENHGGDCLYIQGHVSPACTPRLPGRGA